MVEKQAGIAEPVPVPGGSAVDSALALLQRDSLRLWEVVGRLEKRLAEVEKLLEYAVKMRLIPALEPGGGPPAPPKRKSILD